MTRHSLKFRDLVGKATDSFANHTGICFFRDPLNHPGTDDVVTLAVPGYRQIESFTCGFVAGLMVVHTFNPKACIDKFYHAVRPTYELGASASKVTRALRASNVGVSVRRNLSFPEIRRQIDAGFPIIACVTTRDPEVDHWVVIYGYGLAPQRLFLAAEGRLIFPRREILWQQYQKRASSKGFGLVCWGKS